MQTFNCNKYNDLTVDWINNLLDKIIYSLKKISGVHACNIERERERVLEVLEGRLVFGNMLDVCRVGVKKKRHTQYIEAEAGHA